MFDIVLSELQTTHAPFIQKWKNDSALSDLILSDYNPITLSQAVDWIKATNQYPNQLAKIIECTNTEKKMPIGLARLMYINYQNENAELGIYIAENEYQGKGLGKKAMQLLLDEGFEKLKLKKIYLKVATTNKAAIALYLKSGFIIEGELKKHIFRHNEYIDLTLMAIFKSTNNE